MRNHFHSINLPVFKSGGVEWYISCLPHGELDLPSIFGSTQEKDSFISLFLCLCGFRKPVVASFKLTISSVNESNSISKNFAHTFATNEKFGHKRFLRRVDLVEQYLENEFSLVLCSINVRGETEKSNEVPKCLFRDIREDVMKLLESRDMTDVKFEVEGEIFTAHKVILSARSPVFKAELFGSMAESSVQCIEIKDMKREVFKALLHFIYTDSICEARDADIGLSVVMQHLLVAADRYSIEMLMVNCEEELRKNVSFETILGLLIFAADHNFCKIKNTCLEFAAQKDNLLRIF